MTNKTWAIINTDGLVENTILWDGISLWSPPVGTTCIEITDTDVSSGWYYVDGVFELPKQPELTNSITE